MSWSDIIEQDMYETDQTSAMDWLEEHGDREYRLSVELADLEARYSAFVETVRGFGEELSYNGQSDIGNALIALVDGIVAE